MAQKFDKIILQVRRPSKNAFLVGMPMELYRVQSHDFGKGINFFQKAVLLFKQRRDITNGLIASILKIDEKLVYIIEGELKDRKLLSSEGIITDAGLDACRYTDGLIINPENNRIGYILKPCGDDEYYPYYVDSFDNRNVFSRNPFKVVIKQTETETGEEKEYYSDDIYLLQDNRDFNANQLPTPLTALDIITRTSLRNDFLLEPEDCKRLAIHFVPDNKPLNALVCTYIYLPLIEEDTYSSDWEVLDPFGRGNSVHLKFYIERCNDEILKQKIHDDFALATTSEFITYGEIQNRLNKAVEEIINQDFSKSIENMEESIVSDLQLVVKMRLCMEYDNYSSRDKCDSYSSYLQQQQYLH